jgi:hypothetical protein
MRRAATRWLRAAVAAAIASAVVALGPAALAAPTVTLVPSTVPTSGQLVTVQVAGCPPGLPITIASTAQTHPLATLNADGAGSAVTSVASAPTAGVFTVSVMCGGATASAEFTVVAPPSAGHEGAGTPAVVLLGVAGGLLAGALLLIVALVVVRRRFAARPLT